MARKQPKNKFDWGFLSGCRFHLHGFENPVDGEHCYCGMTILRQRAGGWDAVWNTHGVGFKKRTSNRRYVRRQDNQNRGSMIALTSAAKVGDKITVKLLPPPEDKV